MLDSTDFPRVRVGVLPSNDVYDLTRFVLTPLWGKEKTLMASMVEIAADAVEMLLSNGLTAAMNKYNGLDLLQTDSDPDTHAQ
jgi:PTH1 family peptidyl-tRNA hydrolase